MVTIVAPSPLRRGTCDGCRATLEWQVSEEVVKRKGSSSKGPIYKRVLVCPACENETTVPIYDYLK